jgi:hypothetical protein
LSFLDVCKCAQLPAPAQQHPACILVLSIGQLCWKSTLVRCRCWPCCARANTKPRGPTQTFKRTVTVDERVEKQESGCLKRSEWFEPEQKFASTITLYQADRPSSLASNPGQLQQQWRNSNRRLRHQTPNDTRCDSQILAARTICATSNASRTRQRKTILTRARLRPKICTP